VNDLWADIRILNFILFGIAWIILLYKGALKLTLDPKNFNWDRFMNFIWCFVAAEGTAEQLYLATKPGPRVIVATVIGLLQIWISLTKIHVKEEAGYE
jgi:hypothetical protein